MNKVKYRNSRAAKQEIRRFVEMFGSVRAAAKAIGVQFQTIYGWNYDRSAVTRKQAEAIELVTNGACIKDILMLREKVEPKRKTFYDFIIKDHLKKRINFSDLTIDDFFDGALSEKLTAAIKNIDSIQFESHKVYLAQLLCVIFGFNEAYWINEINKYKK